MATAKVELLRELLGLGDSWRIIEGSLWKKELVRWSEKKRKIFTSRREPAAFMMKAL